MPTWPNLCGGGHVWQGVCMAGGMHGRGVVGGHAWQERRPLQQTVSILLECILVFQVLPFIWGKVIKCDKDFEGSVNIITDRLVLKFAIQNCELKTVNTHDIHNKIPNRDQMNRTPLRQEYKWSSPKSKGLWGYFSWSHIWNNSQNQVANK